MKIKRIISNIILSICFVTNIGCNTQTNIRSSRIKSYQVLLMPFTISLFLYRNCNSAFCEIKKDEDLICRSHSNFDLFSKTDGFCCQSDFVVNSDCDKREEDFNGLSGSYLNCNVSFSSFPDDFQNAIDYFVVNSDCDKREEDFNGLSGSYLNCNVSFSSFPDDFQNAIDYYKAFDCHCYSFECYEECSCKRSPHCNLLRDFVLKTPSNFKDDGQFYKLHESCIEEIKKKSNKDRAVSRPRHIGNNLLKFDAIIGLNEYEIDATVILDNSDLRIMDIKYGLEIRSNSEKEINRLELDSPNV